MSSETAPNYRPSTRHADLGEAFYDIVQAAIFPQHILRYRNQHWAERVGLGNLTDAEWIAHFARFEPLPGSFAQPLALRYHGHQFRSYNPDLGDGRGFLFAQLHDLQDGRLLDLGTKGSGLTPWSRGGDGRLTLKGGVREVLATAMLEALGVYTSKSFSLIETGEALVRGDEPSPTRGAVLVRLNHTHIRIGTFQRFAFAQDVESLRRLVDHSIAVAMPRSVARRSGRAGGGVPGGGLPARGAVGRAVDGGGFRARRAEHRQHQHHRREFRLRPVAVRADLRSGVHRGLFRSFRAVCVRPPAGHAAVESTRLAECLLALAPQAALEAALATYVPAFRAALAGGVVRRLGLQPRDAVEDSALSEALWAFLADSQAGFEQVFFDWFGGRAGAARAQAGPERAKYSGVAFEAFRELLFAYEPAASARLSDPYFTRARPCTMLIEEVERIWAPIAESDDWSVFEGKLVEISGMARAYGISQ